MRTLLFKKSGEIILEDKFTEKKEKISTLRHYLDCPVIIEEGLLFETFFNHILNEKDFFNNIFKETMESSSLDNFIEEWNNPVDNLNSDIKLIKAYKVFDYIELPENESFVDIRIDFDGEGESGEIYNIEFIPLNVLKKIPFVLSENMSIHRTVSNLKGEELFFKGRSFTLLFELIGSILYVITIHNTPEERDSAKKKFTHIINDSNIIDILEKQKEESIENQNYEEASQIKKILDRLSNGFINK
tara:strand:- start:3029 stop:3763 length:735 start_codon:yes stop_codon:yes gene_type:complete